MAEAYLKDTCYPRESPLSPLEGGWEMSYDHWCDMMSHK